MVGNERRLGLMCEKADVGTGWWRAMDYLLSLVRAICILTLEGIETTEAVLAMVIVNL
jgi:hypothetical protein